MDRYSAFGRCTCGTVRYQLVRKPLFVHCCHCTWCQRETGTAFALNAMIEAEAVEVDGAGPECVVTPSASGKGQRIWRCADCRVALWSNYAGAGPGVHFIRVGTLEQPALLPPDVHIFTATRQPWVVLPADVPSFAEFYDMKALWPAASLERLRQAKAAQAARGG